MTDIEIHKSHLQNPQIPFVGPGCVREKLGGWNVEPPLGNGSNPFARCSLLIFLHLDISYFKIPIKPNFSSKSDLFQWFNGISTVRSPPGILSKEHKTLFPATSDTRRLSWTHAANLPPARGSLQAQDEGLWLHRTQHKYLQEVG
jgi:hypothetical protein